MKRTFTVNINNIIFNIDEDAYEHLQKYLHSIRDQFADNESLEEIMINVKTRLSQLFQPQISSTKQVINLADVLDAIEELGQLKDFDSDGEEDKKEEKKKEKSESDKRLFRDGENKIIGGVCSGISAYFNINPLIVRILFVVLALLAGSSIIIYLILWIAIPEAKTSIEKLQMKGDKIDIESITEKIKQEFEGFESRINKIKDDTVSAANTYGTNKETKTLSEKILHNIFKIGELVFKFIVSVFGFILIFVGLFALVGFIFSLVSIDSSFFISDVGFNSFSIQSLVDVFADSSADKTLLIIGIIISIGIPLIMLVYNGMKLVFKWKYEVRFIGISVFTLWLMGAILSGLIIFRIFSDFSQSGTYVEKQNIERTRSGNLYIKPLENETIKAISHSTNRYQTGRWNMYQTTDEDIIFGSPEIHIFESKNNRFELEISKYHRSKKRETANLKAQNIKYEFVQENDTLFLSPYYFVTENYSWRGQKVIIEIFVPKYRKINLDNGISHLLRSDYNTYIWEENKNEETTTDINIEEDSNAEFSDSIDTLNQ